MKRHNIGQARTSRLRAGLRLLVFLGCVSLVAASAFAQEDTEGTGSGTTEPTTVPSSVEQDQAEHPVQEGSGDVVEVPGTAPDTVDGATTSPTDSAEAQPTTQASAPTPEAPTTEAPTTEAPTTQATQTETAVPAQPSEPAQAPAPPLEPGAELPAGHPPLNVGQPAMPDLDSVDTFFEGTVDVIQRSEAGEVPMAGVLIQVQPVFGGEPYRGVTDASGRATFTLPEVDADFQVRAQFHGVVFTSDTAIRAGVNSRAVIEVADVRSDASHVRAEILRLQLDAWEGYIVVDQYWQLSNDAPFVYAPELPSDGISFPMPPDADSFHVQNPTNPDDYIESNTGILLRAAIPPSASGGSTTFRVRFSIPNTAVAHLFEQPLPVPVDAAAIGLGLETRFEGYEHLDVDLKVPLCSEVSEADFLCFPAVDTEQRGHDWLAGLDHRIVLGGRAEAGASLTFETDGWPVPPNQMQWLAKMGVFAIGLLGLGFIVVNWNRRSSKTSIDSLSRDGLLRARVELLEALNRVRGDHDGGFLPKSEFELTDLLLRHRLEGVYTALGVEVPVQPDAEEATNDGDEDRGGDVGT